MQDRNAVSNLIALEYEKGWARPDQPKITVCVLARILRGVEEVRTLDGARCSALARRGAQGSFTQQFAGCL